MRIDMDNENVDSKSQATLGDVEMQLINTIYSMLFQTNLTRLQEIKTFVEVYIS